MMVPLIYSMMFFSILAQIFHTPTCTGKVGISYWMLNTIFQLLFYVETHSSINYWNKNTYMYNNIIINSDHVYSSK